LTKAPLFFTLILVLENLKTGGKKVPYIPKESQREFLDSFIDAIVSYIDSHKRFDYSIIQKFAVKKLALLMHPQHKRTILLNFELNKKYHPEEEVRTFYQELVHLIIALSNQIDDLIKSSGKLSWVGMLNYCCTEILLLSTHERRYHVMSLLKETCRRVSHELEAEFNRKDIVGFRICGVFDDIADEFYRRVIAPYEEEQINKLTHGDTRGYLKWLPKLEK
jgi:transcription termination factor NusB